MATKIFAIYADIKLIKKPEWLDEFRKKYDKPYEFHVTLKQPCFVEEGKTVDLKQKVSDFFTAVNVEDHKISLAFDDLVVAEKDGVSTIMLKAHDVFVLADLQKSLCNTLAEYKNYVKPKSEDWEKNFDPHITIARNITKDQYQEATDYLKGNYVCEGIIESIILSVVKEDTPEEAKNPLNQTVYKL
ncbi:MAG: 2'-5' RNA ligase family protein [Candidatus Paceibacterota bacterium]|jgi:2'-5' RNA ligase